MWSTWTTKKAQPMHTDPVLQALVDQSLQTESKTADQTYQGNVPSSSDTATGSKGSQLQVSDDSPPFPTSEEDVNMEAPVDKRSRESPDSTLKPEGKSLKTSGVATATSAEPDVSCVCAAVPAATNEGDTDVPEPPTVRWKVKENSEIRPLMWQLQHRMPAWKLKACVDALQVRPVDLAVLIETTGVQFASAELVEVTAKCLEEITKEVARDESDTSGTTAVTSSHDKEPREKDEPDLQEKKSQIAENFTEKKNPDDQSTNTGAASQESKSKDTDADEQQKDATASPGEPKPEKDCDQEKEQSKNWITNVVNAGLHVLWPQGMTPSAGPTLLTGVKIGDEDRFVDDLMEWERKFENANWDDHVQFLRKSQLTAEIHLMEAAAWENGYVPEAQGLPSDQLESRIQESLPPLAYMVSRPRQPIAIGEGLLCRFDAGIRP